MAMELVTRLPYDHPYRWDGTAVGGVKLWRPDELGADLALWLDAEDTSTITLNGGNVSQWDDKSGNGRNISQAVAAQQPAYDAVNKIITFDGSDDYLFNATVGAAGFTSVSMLTVMRMVSGGANQDLPMGTGETAVGGAIRCFFRSTGSTTVGFAGWSRDVGSSDFSYDIGGDYHIFAGWNTQLATPANVRLSRDGATPIAYTTSNGNLSSTVDGFSVGSLRGSLVGNYYSNISVREIVVLYSAITDTDRQKLEGYLAHKWGLTDNLPVEHPYKITPPYAGKPVYDPDAQTYFNRVEGPSGDNQTLEPEVKTAINDFVVGCKDDGIWSAIKSSAILAGARTLSGALQPLVGTAPTNFNFVSGDYNRKTGLVGDGSTKYLSSNRTVLASPAENCHLSVFPTEAATSTGTMLIGGDTSVPSFQMSTATNFATQIHNRVAASNNSFVNSLIGGSNTSSELTGRYGGLQSTATGTTVVAADAVITVFCRNSSGAPRSPTDARIAFYSIGESLDLAALDTRVSALMTALDGAIA